MSPSMYLCFWLLTAVARTLRKGEKGKEQHKHNEAVDVRLVMVVAEETWMWSWGHVTDAL